MRRALRSCAVALLALCATAAAARELPGTAAPRAFIMDFTTGQPVLAKNADQATAPASLAKLMTAAVVFDELKGGRLRLTDEFTVSESAARSARGSTMALRAGMRVGVGDLLQGLVVQSANDAAVVLAEGIAGSVSGFAGMMNERAREIGLRASRFANPHGLPAREQHVTMRDMALLAAHLIREHPDLYPIFGQKQFTFRGTTYANRNPLLGRVDGADGLKTGQTARAGFALVASVERGGRRLILAMNGLKSEAERDAEARKLLEAAFLAQP